MLMGVKKQLGLGTDSSFVMTGALLSVYICSNYHRQQAYVFFTAWKVHYTTKCNHLLLNNLKKCGIWVCVLSLFSDWCHFSICVIVKLVFLKQNKTKKRDTIFHFWLLGPQWWSRDHVLFHCLGTNLKWTRGGRGTDRQPAPAWPTSDGRRPVGRGQRWEAAAGGKAALRPAGKREGGRQPAHLQPIRRRWVQCVMLYWFCILFLPCMGKIVELIDKKKNLCDPHFSSKSCRWGFS